MGADTPQDVRPDLAVIMAQDIPDSGDLGPGMSGSAAFRWSGILRLASEMISRLRSTSWRTHRSAAKRSKSRPAVSASIWAIA